MSKQHWALVASIFAPLILAVRFSMCFNTVLSRTHLSLPRLRQSTCISRCNVSYAVCIALFRQDASLSIRLHPSATLSPFVALSRCHNFISYLPLFGTDTDAALHLHASMLMIHAKEEFAAAQTRFRIEMYGNTLTDLTRAKYFDGLRSRYAARSPLLMCPWSAPTVLPPTTQCSLQLHVFEVCPEYFLLQMANLATRGCHKDAHPFHSLMFGGYPPTAIGYPPTTIGYPPTAIGYPPTAIGYPPTAIGYPPTAIGYPPTAIGYPPTAIGYPPAAIVGRIGHSEFFFSFIMAPPACHCHSHLVSATCRGAVGGLHFCALFHIHMLPARRP